MAILSAQEVFERLTENKKPCSYSEFLAQSESLSKIGGIYGIYFKEMPPYVKADKRLIRKDKTLLYVGKVNYTKKRNMYKRIDEHYDSKARRSTLRQSLCVLFHKHAPEDMPALFCTKAPKKNKYYYHLPEDGEVLLSAWIKNNAFVCWVEHESPNAVEEDVIEKAGTPLNKKRGEVRLPGIVGEIRQEVRANARNLFLS